MPPDEPTDEERLEELPEDNETPFRPANLNPDDATGDPMTRVDRTGGLDSTHPQTDTNIQDEELYDEGISGAAEAEEPRPGDAVVGYDPEKDQRRTTVSGAISDDDDDNQDDDDDKDDEE